jgi:hypothetical protein
MWKCLVIIEDSRFAKNALQRRLNMARYLIGMCCALAIAMAGCGGANSKTGKDGKPITQVSLPDSPEGTMQAMIDNTAKGEIQVWWQALPEQHQQDVKEILVLTGEKLDPEVYDQGMALVNKLVAIAKDKQDFILGNALVQNNFNDPAAAKKQFATFVKLVETLTQSEIKTVQGLKTLDPEVFLANTGKDVFAVLESLSELQTAPGEPKKLEAFKSAKVTLVKKEGDNAIIKMSVDGQPDREEKLVKVGGKWIFAEWAEGWEKGIASAKRQLKDYKMTPDQKKQALDSINQLSEILTTFAAAKTQAEFDAALGDSIGKAGNAVMPLMGAGGGIQPSAQSEGLENPQPNLIPSGG